MKKLFCRRKRDFFETDHLVEIWGKSNCSYCDNTIALCVREGLNYIYHQLDEDYTKEELLKLFPNTKTLPQITVDNTYIGGFMDLRHYLVGPPDTV